MCIAGLGGGSVKWYSHHKKTVWPLSKKIKIKLLCDPAILLLGMYSKQLKTEIRTDVCTSMFITALLFTIVKR